MRRLLVVDGWTFSSRPLCLIALTVGLVTPFLCRAIPAEATFPGQDGGRVVFTQCIGAGEGCRPEVVALDGTQGGPIYLRNIHDAYMPAQSPAEDEIAFSALDQSLCRNGHLCDNLFLAVPPSRVPVRITHSPSGSDTWPAWSPDGTEIVFSRSISGHSNLYIKNLVAGTLQQFTNTRSAINTQPDWSPDGTNIAFASNRSGNSDIWIRSLSGHLTQVTRNPANERYPSWSPDGTSIAFSSDRATPGAGLYEKAPAGTSATLLHSGGTQPAWSPDGTKIAFLGLDEIDILTIGDGVTILSPASRDGVFSPDWQSVNSAP